MKHLTILIVHPSEVITLGLHTLIKSLRHLSVTVVSTNDPYNLDNKIRINKPSLIITDPTILSLNELEDIKKEYPKVQLIGILTSLLPASFLRFYNDTITLYDGKEKIERILSSSNLTPSNDAETKELSPREKEVVIGIVKGLSNKEIANEINVSVNTVMTHRRNIAAKLQIHSPAGLTIYAIVSKLVKIEDIKI